MKRLLWLYPRAWRARYQAEMSAMLEASHLSWRDALDLIMGALDARLDPQTAGAEGRRWTRALGVVGLTAAGGLLFFTFEYLPFPVRGYGISPVRHSLIAAGLWGGLALITGLFGARLAACFFGVVVVRYGLSFAFASLPIWEVVFRSVGFHLVTPIFPLHILLLDGIQVTFMAIATTVLLRWTGVRWRVGLVVAFALELLVMNWDFWMIAAHPLSPLYWQLVSAMERASVNHYGAGTLLDSLFALKMAVWAAVIATIATRRTRRRPTPVPART